MEKWTVYATEALVRQHDTRAAVAEHHVRAPGKTKSQKSTYLSLANLYAEKNQSLTTISLFQSSGDGSGWLTIKSHLLQVLL